MKFHEFRNLAPEDKNMEILKMLPMLTPLSEEFTNLKNSLTIAMDKVHQLYLTLFRSDGYQFDTCLPFSLYLRHGFRSESEQIHRNRVKIINE